MNWSYYDELRSRMSFVHMSNWAKMRLKRNFHWIITQKFRLTVGGHSPSACMPLIFTTPKVKTHKNNRLLMGGFQGGLWCLLLIITLLQSLQMMANGGRILNLFDVDDNAKKSSMPLYNPAFPPPTVGQQHFRLHPPQNPSYQYERTGMSQCNTRTAQTVESAVSCVHYRLCNSCLPCKT